MDTDMDVCIARRRTPRACTRKAPSASSTSEPHTESTSATKPEQQLQSSETTVLVTKTSAKPKSRKRVRFSDPGPQGDDSIDEEANVQLPSHDRVAALSSTGLTPMIRRSSLGSTITSSSTVSPSAKRRRHSSTPVSSTSVAMCSPSAATATGQEGGSIHFPSLRQILSDRVKRRIRRNGLSEEMNAIEAEKKQAQQQGREAEVEALRDLLAEKDAEIERLREMSMLDTTDSSIGDGSVVGPTDVDNHDMTMSLPPATHVHQQSSPAGMDLCGSSKLMNLEREVEHLRRELSSRSSPPHGSSSSVVRGHDDDDESRFYDWTMKARDPFSDEYTDMDMDVNVDDTHLEDSAFGDSTMVDLVCSTPSRRQRGSSTVASAGGVGTGHGANMSVSAGSSFPTPPCTSPTIPATPCSIRQLKSMLLPVTPRSHTAASVQASLPDPETIAVKAELESLQLELSKITEALESQAASQARIASKISSGLAETAPKTQQAELSSDNSEENLHDKTNVESQLDRLLQIVSDRTAALHDLNSSLTSLGFPGTDASEVITSLTSSLRAARLELEYLTPGELTIPLTSHGAEVLDLVLTALRDLARKEHEHEQTIDEYHALELSLRQQLRARVSATDAMRAELKDSSAALAGRDEKISDLEVGIDRLKGAAEGYRRDIAELETLVQRMEDDMLAAADASEIAVSARDRHIAELKTAAATSERRFQGDMSGKQDELDRCEGAMAELGAKLAAVIEQTETFDAELSALHATKDREIRALNRGHGKSLAVRDARVAELRGEIDSINASLRRAYGTIQALRVENLALARQVETEKTAARTAIDGMKAEMQRAVKVSSGFLATPRRTSSRRSASGGAGVATPSRRKSARTSSLAVPEIEVTATPPLAKPAKRPRRYDSGIGLDEYE